MSTLTVYPSLDGYVIRYNASGEAWAALRDGAGTSAVDDGEDTGAAARISSGSSTDEWTTLARSILLFDTSALGSSVAVTAAVLSLYGYDKQDELGITPSTGIYSSNPASDSALVAADFATLGAEQFSNFGYANWSTSGYNVFTLNVAGIAAISKTGITKLGVRNPQYDALNVEPDSWSAGRTSYVYFYYNEKGTIYRPKLVITYSGAPAVTTLACTNTIAQKSTGHAILTDIGAAAVTQHGHCWNTSSNPTVDGGGNYLAATTLGAAPNLGHFTSLITGLTPGTKYYVRAYATNSTGTSYGGNVEIAGNVTTIGHREWWVEKKDFCYFDEYGQERHIEGRPVTSGLPWWRFT